MPQNKWNILISTKKSEYQPYTKIKNDQDTIRKQEYELVIKQINETTDMLEKAKTPEEITRLRDLLIEQTKMLNKMRLPETENPEEAAGSNYRDPWAVTSTDTAPDFKKQEDKKAVKEDIQSKIKKYETTPAPIGVASALPQQMPQASVPVIIPDNTTESVESRKWYWLWLF